MNGSSVSESQQVGSGKTNYFMVHCESEDSSCRSQSQCDGVWFVSGGEDCVREVFGLCWVFGNDVVFHTA